MICQTVDEAIKASKQAEQEKLKGLYPSATIILAREVERLKSILKTIAFPRHGTEEEIWDVKKIGEYAAEALETSKNK